MTDLDISEQELVFKTEALKTIKLSDNELSILLDILEQKYETNIFTFISVILKDNFFKFIDCFEGKTITIPEYKDIVKFIDDCKFYNAYQNIKNKSKDITNEEAIRLLALQIKKSELFTARRIKRIESIFTPKQLKLKI